jgi:hypothetical protein
MPLSTFFSTSIAAWSDQTTRRCGHGWQADSKSDA